MKYFSNGQIRVFCSSFLGRKHLGYIESYCKCWFSHFTLLNVQRLDSIFVFRTVILTAFFLKICSVLKSKPRHWEIICFQVKECFSPKTNIHSGTKERNYWLLRLNVQPSAIVPFCSITFAAKLKLTSDKTTLFILFMIKPKYLST